MSRAAQPRISAALAVALASMLLMMPRVTAAEYVIVIDKLQFGEVPADLHVGDVVVWQNSDILRHTATARDASFDVDLPAGAEGRTILEQAGTFEVFCKYHPGMLATLVVTP